MKCLSLKQPYAELIISGKKTIELRKWNTKFRGEFLVHASKKINKEAAERNNIDYTKLVTGGIIGKVTLYDVKVYENKNSFLKDKNKHLAPPDFKNYRFGFLVKNPRRFKKPILIAGKLRFFDVDL